MIVYIGTQSQFSNKFPTDVWWGWYKTIGGALDAKGQTMTIFIGTAKGMAEYFVVPEWTTMCDVWNAMGSGIHTIMTNS